MTYSSRDLIRHPPMLSISISIQRRLKYYIRRFMLPNPYQAPSCHTTTLNRLTATALRARNTIPRKMNTDNSGNLCLYTSATATGRPGWVEHFESQLKDHPSAKCTRTHLSHQRHR